jgi:adhesin HecA-like repeat protein
MSGGAGRVRLGAAAALALAGGLLVAAPDLLVRAGQLQNRWEGRPADPVVCSFRVRTGHPCLGCGGTRALRLASHGQLGEAVRENALGAWAGVALWASLLVGVGSLASGRVPSWRLLVIGYTVSGLAMFVWTFLDWWRRLAAEAAGIS